MVFDHIIFNTKGYVCFMLKPNEMYRENGKDYRVIDRAYVEQQMSRKGLDGEPVHPTVTAQKKACLIVRPAIEGEQIVVYNAAGEVEANETCTAGNWVVKSVDLDGVPILTDAGQENIWQMTDKTFKKKYDTANIQPNGFVKPKGGLQTFLQVQENICLYVPWGEGGAPIPQVIDKGGYINVTNLDDLYGISGGDFDNLYAVEAQSSEVDGGRRLPEMPDMTEDGGLSYGDVDLFSFV